MGGALMGWFERQLGPAPALPVAPSHRCDGACGRRRCARALLMYWFRADCGGSFVMATGGIWNEVAGSCIGAVVGVQLTLLTTTIGERGALWSYRAIATLATLFDDAADARGSGNPQSIIVAAQLSYIAGDWVFRGVNNVREALCVRAAPRFVRDAPCARATPKR